MLKQCPNCKKIYNQNEFYCLKCRYKLVQYKQIQSNEEITSTIVPQCPTCKSKNITTIPNSKRMIYGLIFGLFSKTATSQFECKNCGYKW